jgi:hypothetical protein
MFYTCTFKPVLRGHLWDNFLCNRCLSPLMLWVRISNRASCTPLCDKVCLWLVTGRWSGRGVHHYVIKFVCDLWQVSDQGEVYNKHYVIKFVCSHNVVSSTLHHWQTLSHNVVSSTLHHWQTLSYNVVSSTLHHWQTLSHNVVSHYVIKFVSGEVYSIQHYVIQFVSGEVYSIQHYVIKFVSGEVYSIQHYVIKFEYTSPLTNFIT